MDRDNVSRGSLDIDQLKKYAQDFSEVYKSEKAKSRELEAAHRQLVKYAEDFNKNYVDLKAAHQDLQEAYLDTIHRLVRASEYKDEDTGAHIVRMGRYSALIAQKLGFTAREVQIILYAAPMHDVGKIGIPDNILMKPGKLTEEEVRIMRTHSTIGANILAYSKAEVLKVAEQIAISHHEKWDGTGYPLGLAGEDIPLVGRIVGIADVFDALTSKRPYRGAYSIEAAIDIITKDRGRHFDPRVADVFLENIDEVLKEKEEVNSTQDMILSDTTRGETSTESG
ncbi:MAG: HD domain-containing protein [Desulfobacterales bacterium]|nr:HD domain-containing protein [Desulfobacterales bacterium]